MISFLLYAIKCWSVSSQMKEESLGNEDVVLKKDAQNTTEGAYEEVGYFNERRKKKLLLDIRKRQLQFRGHIMSNEDYYMDIVKARKNQ